MSVPQNLVTSPLPSTPVSHAVGQAAVEPSIWERISDYVSEHKVAVCTIGAVVVVFGAGGVYYYSTQASSKKAGTESKSGKERKRKGDKKKKEAEAGKEKEKEDGEIELVN